MSVEAQGHSYLAYSRVWEWREDDVEPYWIVRLAEIPEVVGDGITRAEAEAALHACFDDYVAYRRVEGLPVPAPEAEAEAG